MRPTRAFAIVTAVVAIVVIGAALLWPKPHRSLEQHMTVEIISPPPPPPPPTNGAR